MRNRFVLVMVAVVVVVLAVRDVPLGFHLARIERERVITKLERDAYVLAGRLAQPAADGLAPSEVFAELSRFARANSTDVIVVDASGTLVASTNPGATLGDSYLNRPEIVSGLLGEFDSGSRESASLGEKLTYAAVPVLGGGAPIGVVRLSSPESVINDAVFDQVRGLLLGALVSIVIGIVAALLMAMLLTRPIIALRDATQRFARDADADPVDESGPGELRQLARAFNDMSSRVSRMLDRQRRFSGDAAHQLRTPLTALRLRLESASDSLGDQPSAAREHLDAAVSETDRLAALTEQMLMLARTEGAALLVENFDLSDLVRNLAQEWTALAADFGVTLTVTAPAELHVVSAPAAWREIISNYIDNGLAHGASGKSIEIIASRVGSGAEVVVRDAGRGLDDADRTRAFDRFWRGAASNSSDGSGLGLAVVAQLAASASLHVELRRSPAGGIDAVVASR